MVNPLSVVSGVTYLIAGVVLVFVGWRFWNRSVSAAAKLASTEFTTYWYCLSASAFVSGLGILLTAVGAYGFDLALTIYLCSLLLDTVLLASLVGYLTYLYTGRYFLVPLVTLYGLFYVAALGYVVGRDPIGVQVQDGVTTIVYAYPSQGPLFGIVALGLLVPPIAAGIAYFSLIRLTRVRQQRYRIVLVTASIFVWFLTALFLPSPTTPGPTLATLAEPLVEVFAGLFAFFAFFPPGQLRRWLERDSPPRAPADPEAVPSPGSAP